MSAVDFEGEASAALARLELLQGIVVGDVPAIRRELYDRFGEPDDPWADKARAAYSAMSSVGGYVASVGDVLAAELDIREHADVYAAVGGFDVTEITHGLGSWWSPSAIWFRSGRVLSGLQDTSANVEFETTARPLLEAGASSLANFFATVADGGMSLVSSGSWLPSRRKQQREFSFFIEVMLARSQLFRDGPGEDGRYLHGERVSKEEILEFMRSRKPTPRSDTPALR